MECLTVKRLATLSLLLILCISCKKESKDETREDKEILIFSANGDINPTLDNFRTILGSPVNTTPDAVGGRREINWDAVPAEFVGTKLPDDFFNPTGPNAVPSRQRGLMYSAGEDFRISATKFTDVNSASSSEFAAFSGDKVFANLSSALWQVFPKKPGTKEAGKIKGFGIVFADVDRANSTSLEFFDDDLSLGKYFVKPHDEKSKFSFLGVYFKNKSITRIQVSHDGTLAGNDKDITVGGTRDMIVLDDFLYDEPVKK